MRSTTNSLRWLLTAFFLSFMTIALLGLLFEISALLLFGITAGMGCGVYAFIFVLFGGK